MKVLHLSSERTWRGGEQQIAYLILELIKKGIDCRVACKKGSAFEEWCETNDIPYISLGYKNELDIITASKIKAYCNKNTINITHIHSSHSHAMAVWSSILGNKSKLILSRRVDFPIKNNLFSKLKFNYKGIKRIVSISGKIQDILEKDIKNKTILRTVYSGIDINRFKNSQNTGKLHSEFGLNKDCKIVANISAIAPHKDYRTFVDTIDEIIKTKSNIHFLIIGDGPCRNEIECYVSSKQLSDKITLTGFRNDIPEIIQEIDVFLMTSETEGLGTTILDAFANKVPVVATNAGGIPEAVINEKTGLISNIKDYKALAKNVNRILDDDTLAKTLTESAHKHLLRNFTIEKMARGNIDVYNEITT